MSTASGIRRRTKRRHGLSLGTALAVVTASTMIALFPGSRAFAADSASINGGTTYQTVAGFGASEAFGQAAGIMNASSSIQSEVLSLLYSPTSGAGLTILRNEIGADSGNSIEPTNPGGPSATPKYQTLAQTDQDQGQLWFAQQIKSRFGVSDIYGDAWSAPGYMKTNGSALNGGQVCGTTGAGCSSGDWRQAYANYLTQYARDYAAAGVPLTYVGPSNEPDFSASYDSMTMSPAQMASLLDVVGPTVRDSGLGTQVSCCAATGWPNAAKYTSAIEADPTAVANTAVATGHGYSGAPTSPLSGWNKPAWETEWYGTSNAWDTAWDDGTADSGYAWAQNIFTGLTKANVSAYLFWWGSNDFSNANTSLVQLRNGAVSSSGRLWAFGNYSRYVHPGAVRIGATSSTGSVNVAAFKNTDGSVAIVALNSGSGSDAITYSLADTGISNGATVTPYLTNGSNSIAAQGTTSVSNGAFSASVPARSLVTYVIPGGSVSAGNTVTVTNPGSQTGTVGTAVSGLQIHAADSASGQVLRYSATGLPAGLSISSSGLITGTPTAAATSSVTVTATDTTGASGTATFAWTVSNASGGGGGGTCSVSYTTASEWAGGFTANVTITNTSTTAVNGWTLKFAFPGDQQITSGWNGTPTQSGKNVTITNAGYNGAIAPGANTSTGFQGTWTSSDAPPTSFTVNGAACG